MNCDIGFAQGQILKYRAALDAGFQELARLARGLRHFDQLPGQSEMVDTTEQRRSEKLADVEMLHELIRLPPMFPAADHGLRNRSTRIRCHLTPQTRSSLLDLGLQQQWNSRPHSAERPVR